MFLNITVVFSPLDPALEAVLGSEPCSTSGSESERNSHLNKSGGVAVPENVVEHGCVSDHSICLSGIRVPSSANV